MQTPAHQAHIPQVKSEEIAVPADFGAARGGTAEKSNPNTLYVGNLHPFVDENTLQEVFSYAGLLEQVKIVRVCYFILKLI